jgi:hypothetical protein
MLTVLFGVVLALPGGGGDGQQGGRRHITDSEALKCFGDLDQSRFLECMKSYNALTLYKVNKAWDVYRAAMEPYATAGYEFRKYFYLGKLREAYIVQ